MKAQSSETPSSTRPVEVWQKVAVRSPGLPTMGPRRSPPVMLRMRPAANGAGPGTKVPARRSDGLMVAGHRHEHGDRVPPHAGIFDNRAGRSIFARAVCRHDTLEEQGDEAVMRNLDATARSRSTYDCTPETTHGRRLSVVHPTGASGPTGTRPADLLLDSVVDGVIQVDRAGVVRYANRAAGRLLGSDASALVGGPAHALLPRPLPASSADDAGDCPVCRTLDGDRAPRARDVTVSRPDGSSTVVDLSFAPMVSGGIVTGAVVTLADATERHTTRRREEEFITLVSHELRTPLTSIRASLGLLAGGVLGDLPEDMAEMMRVALSNTERLTRLVNDILDLERFAAGHLIGELESLDAAAIVRGVADRSLGLAHEAGVGLDVTTSSVAVRADSHWLAQALTNLVGNAIKFSPPESRVLLGLERRGTTAQMTVRDHGRGIPADRLEHIFDRFAQVEHQDSSSKGGSGLGLPIAQRIVEEHGGRLLVSSVLGEGSTFTIELPVDGATAGEEPCAKGWARA